MGWVTVFAEFFRFLGVVFVLFVFLDGLAFLFILHR